MRNRTFAMIKPGAVQRSLIGEVITRFEKKGFNIIGMKIINVTEEQAKKHYQEHLGKVFYESLINYVTASPAVVLVIEGENAVEVVRKMAGATDPLEAQPGTIRGDYSSNVRNNIIHTSDSAETAQNEINIYFEENEIVQFDKTNEKWIFEYK